MPTFNPEQSKLNRCIDAIFIWMFGGLFCLAGVVTIYCCYAPREAIFLGQLIPQKYFSYFPWGIFIIIFHAYIIFILSLSQSISSVLILSSLFYLAIVLSQELNINLQSRQYRTSHKLRISSNLQLAYRSFQIIMDHWNGTLSSVIWSGSVSFLAVPVIFGVILLHSWKQLDIFAKFYLILGLICSATAWLLILQSGKYLWWQGTKALQSWKTYDSKNKLEQKIMKKFSKSCRLNLFRYGTIVVLERINQFLYVIGLMKWTFKATLALK